MNNIIIDDVEMNNTHHSDKQMSLVLLGFMLCFIILGFAGFKLYEMWDSEAIAKALAVPVRDTIQFFLEYDYLIGGISALLLVGYIAYDKSIDWYHERQAKNLHLTDKYKESVEDLFKVALKRTFKRSFLAYNRDDTALPPLPYNEALDESYKIVNVKTQGHLFAVFLCDSFTKHHPFLLHYLEKFNKALEGKTHFKIEVELDQSNGVLLSARPLD